ncbi:MAG: hypothetical protein JXA54_08480 [Candidatus Heimdallarchaeota archaeon]|nr:hypothetical protein [Candidatus Heimdallarchaeota archaeon]
MVSAYTAYFLFISTAASVLASIFVIILLRQFIKKRTLGTALLAISFLFIAFAETLTAISQYLYVFVGDNFFTGFFQAAFVFNYGIAYIFFYYFSNRHILQDKDFLKSITTIFGTALVTLISAFMFSEILNNVEPSLFYTHLILFGPNVIQFLPTQMAGLIIYIPIFALIHVRIVVRLIKIRRDLENPVSKRGFTYILYSVLFMVLSTLVASLYIIPGINEIPVVVGIVHTLRGGTAIISIIFGYFGWILPDWLKKRIKGKAWIVSQMKKEITAKIAPIASSESVNVNKAVSIVEVSEQ